jgi:uncharacterized phage-associated protein
MSDFDEHKAAQAAAFLLHRAGGSLPLIKLMKLMYLAERLSFARYGEPLTGDHLVSMDHGPVLSATLNHMNGAIESNAHGWDAWVADRAGHNVALRDPSMIRSPEQDLLALSECDLEVLNDVWTEYGHWGKWDLRDFTHTLPEWEDPHGTSMPISMEKLMAAVGHNQDVASGLLDRLTVQRNITKAFDC